MDQKVEEPECEPLDVYKGQNHPGQPWGCYQMKSKKETDDQKNLRCRLETFLTPSTTAKALGELTQRQGAFYCPYLRLRQKALDPKEWLVEGDAPPGAHFPLCVFTSNARARSRAAAQRRAEKYRELNKGNGGRWANPQRRSGDADNSWRATVADDSWWTEPQSWRTWQSEDSGWRHRGKHWVPVDRF